MQKERKNLEASVPNGDDGEIDILELLGVLLAKWPLLLASVIFFSAVGVFVVNYLRPAFTSDALLQVNQSGKSAGLAFGEMGALLDVSSPADAEIELIKSRRVLDEVVEREHLAYSATPVALFPRLFHSEGRVDLGLLHLPKTFGPDAKWFLVALGDSSFRVNSPTGSPAVDGTVGETYRIPVADDTLSICVLKMEATPGEKFLLGELDARKAADNLRGVLEIAEQGKKTGIIQMKMTHRYADRAAGILNSIAETYVRQNVEARSEEATKTLEFLEKQLPGVKAKLDSSEQILSSYRKEEGSIDLTGEARSALEKRLELEKQLLGLQQKYEETTRLFKEDHPTVLALKKQQAQVKREMARLGDETKDLPYKQQEILRLQGDVQVNNSIYTNMLNNIQQLRVVQAGEVGNVRIVDRARIELKPVKPRRKVILLGFAAAGFVLGAGIVFLLRMLSRSGLTSSRDVEMQTGLSVYAKIPESEIAKKSKHFFWVDEDPESSACEALRTLRTSLEFSMDGKVLLVSGLTKGAGKSTVSKNLAAICALNGKKILLVDLDFRGSCLSMRGRKKGLSDYLLGKIPLEDAVEHFPGKTLDLIGAGSFILSPSEMISSSAFGNLISEMRPRYDLIILDTAPVLAVADAQIAARYADFVLLVLRYAKDRLEALEDALSVLDTVGEKKKAIVFNRCLREVGKGYGYGYGYGYGKYRYGKTS